MDLNPFEAKSQGYNHRWPNFTSASKSNKETKENVAMINVVGKDGYNKYAEIV